MPLGLLEHRVSPWPAPSSICGPGPVSLGPAALASTARPVGDVTCPSPASPLTRLTCDQWSVLDSKRHTRVARTESTRVT